jgi:hypothetical protein
MENKIQRTEKKIRAGLTFESGLNFMGGYDLILKYKGKEVGSCDLYPSKSGIADYVMDNFKVDEEYRKNHPQNIKPEEYFGFGSDLIEYVNDFIISLGKSAYLVNGTENKFRQFYQRHGWEELDKGIDSVLIFNKNNTLISF